MRKAEALRANFYEIVASLTWHSQPLSIATFLKSCSFAPATPITNERSDVCILLPSMFVNRRWHKGPRLEARPRSMAAFYEFKAAVSDLIFHRAAKSGARRPACAKFAGAAT